MKRVIYLLSLFFFFQGIVSCSRKHKINRLDKQKTEYQQKYQQQEIRELQKSVWDTNTLRYQLAQGHYRLWDLKGEVHLLSDGSIQAQEAKIHSWTTKDIAFIEDKSQVAHSSTLEANSQIKEEHLSQTSKSKYKTKHKINPSWWVAVPIVIIGVVIWRKRFRR